MSEKIIEQSPQAGKKKKNKIARRENNIHGYLFVAPYAIVFAIFILVPVVLAVRTA